MSDNEVGKVVRLVLAVLERLAARTRTPADDLLVRILKVNEPRLTQAVLALLADQDEIPSPERVTEALDAVGIRV